MGLDVLALAGFASWLALHLGTGVALQQIYCLFQDTINLLSCLWCYI